MFFYEHIRSKPFNEKVAIFIINFLIKTLRFFIINKKQNSENIVIIALHRLGDSVFTIPAIKQIINHHKKNIFLISYPETIPIYNIVFKLINIIELRHNNFFTNDQLARSAARKTIRNLNPSIIYDMTGNVTSASLIFNISATEIIGMNDPYYRSIYTKYKNIRKEPHITDNYLDAIHSVIPFTNRDETTDQNYQIKEFVLIHPFASKNSKEWGLNKFIKLGIELNNKYKCAIVAPPNLISDDIKNEIDKQGLEVFETKSTAELVDVLSRCLLLIGNDSGAVHIANLLGKPTFTIYGPTNPDYHKPLTGRNDYIIKSLKCSSKKNEKICFTFGGVFCPSNECMQALSFDVVYEKVNNFLGRVL